MEQLHIEAVPRAPFNYCIRYSLQVCRAYRYGGAPYSKVVRSTEQPPHIQIWAPFRLHYGASIFNMKLQPNNPLGIVRLQNRQIEYELKVRQKERVPSRFDTRLWLCGLHGRVQIWGLHIELESVTGALSSILKWRQELHFRSCIR